MRSIIKSEKRERTIASQKVAKIKIKAMTQKDKELLLKDLCARLPYRVHMHTNSTDNIELLDIVRDIDYEDQYWINGYYYVEDVRPYLRSMEDMTEEEKKRWEDFCFIDTGEIYDFLNSNHFDYRGLIEKGLALEAPEDMYKD